MSIRPLHDIMTPLGIRTRYDVPAAEVTTIAAGGVLGALCEPENEEQLAELLRALWQAGVTYRVLGAGSNLLIDDRGVAECVVRLGAGFRTMSFVGDATVRVGAASGLMRVSRNLSAQGFAGLEFASGIPASLGGAVRMNAGAHGGQMADILESVDCIDKAGERFTLKGTELNFGYRRAELPAGAIVTAAYLRLRPGHREDIERKRSELLAYRKATQPLTVPSFGSVFKNPSASRSAGAILDGLGLKGRQIGGAEISTLHANWIVNPHRRASVDDVRKLIGECQRLAFERGEGHLEPEVVVWSATTEPPIL